MLLVRILNGDRAALLYQWGCRLEAWCIRHGTRVHYHPGGLPAAKTDLLPVAARIDSQGVLCDQHDAQKELIRSESQNNPRFGRVA